MKRYLILNASGTIPEILVYGYIGAEYENGIIASDFVNQLKALENDHPLINVKINSPGGNVFDGIAMYNAMKSCKAVIHTYNVGVAASMGSILLMAGAKAYMSKSARTMTHQASSGVFGKADEMRASAALLESINKTMCGIYADKTGFTDEDCTAKFLKPTDTWFTAQEALSNKLIDGIYDADTIEVPAGVTGVAALWGHFNDKLIKSENMNITLSAACMQALSLTGTPTAEQIEAAVSSLNSKLTAANLRAENAEKAIADAKKLNDEQAITAILETAKKEGRLTVAAADKLKVDYATNPTGLKAVIDLLPKVPSIAGAIHQGAEAAQAELNALVALGYDKLDREGKLPKLKALSEDAFNKLYKDKFGKEYKK